MDAPYLLIFLGLYLLTWCLAWALDRLAHTP